MQPADFNSYGARRGNHEVMMRGTFANIRLKNLMVPGVEGGVTRLHARRRADVDLRRGDELPGAKARRWSILAGKEYGTGSSRDWAAKGTMLLGVQGGDRRELRAHPPLEPGRHGRPAAAVPGRQDAPDAWLDGSETFDITGVDEGLTPRKELDVNDHPRRRRDRDVQGACRIDTPDELDYYKHGGILQYVLRSMIKQAA